MIMCVGYYSHVSHKDVSVKKQTTYMNWSHEMMELKNTYSLVML